MERIDGWRVGERPPIAAWQNQCWVSLSKFHEAALLSPNFCILFIDVTWCDTTDGVRDPSCSTHFSELREAIGTDSTALISNCAQKLDLGDIEDTSKPSKIRYSIVKRYGTISFPFNSVKCEGASCSWSTCFNQYQLIPSGIHDISSQRLCQIKLKLFSFDGWSYKALLTWEKCRGWDRSPLTWLFPNSELLDWPRCNARSPNVPRFPHSSLRQTSQIHLCFLWNIVVIWSSISTSLPSQGELTGKCCRTISSLARSTSSSGQEFNFSSFPLQAACSLTSALFRSLTTWCPQTLTILLVLPPCRLTTLHP